MAAERSTLDGSASRGANALGGAPDSIRRRWTRRVAGRKLPLPPIPPSDSSRGRLPPRNARGHAGNAANGRRSRNHFRRREVKFELGSAAAAFLRAAIARELPVFEFVPGCPFSYLTTVYFDTADRRFYERARADHDDNDKVRVREYAYRRDDGSFATSGECFLELKQSRGGVVVKTRLATPKSLVGRVLACAPLPEGTNAFGRQRSAYDVLCDFLARFRVRVASAVAYRRQVFQVDEDELRITFDDEIAIYAPPPDLYAALEALTPATLGVPIRRFGSVITEIKCSSGEYPEWLRRALRNHSSKPLSKFTSSFGSLIQGELRAGRPEDGPAVAGSRQRSLPGASASLDDTQPSLHPFET